MKKSSSGEVTNNGELEMKFSITSSASDNTLESLGGRIRSKSTTHRSVAIEELFEPNSPGSLGSGGMKKIKSSNEVDTDTSSSSSLLSSSPSKSSSIFKKSFRKSDGQPSQKSNLSGKETTPSSSSSSKLKDSDKNTSPKKSESKNSSSMKHALSDHHIPSSSTTNNNPPAPSLTESRKRTKSTSNINEKTVNIVEPEVEDKKSTSSAFKNPLKVSKKKKL
eukprot:TRINITY_DN804_c0_g1_i1.p2 TRINITY_DN804_c0_g1~~TRINITY_DN804_c0_g1_i1.p2  ORF type:complete len:221 (-),score=96.86 TRINITY_DN804_c0_g1_i1:1260-1922(-)